MKELDLIDIYRILHPTTVECTFFSSTNGTFSKIDHFIGYKTNEFQIIEIIKNILSEHYGIKLSSQ